jgi:hypothetical protein
MGMKREHKVSIRLRTTNIWDVDSRIDEVCNIRDWVNEQCGWAEDRFEIRIHSMGGVMDVWFEDIEDALMCKLRWS